VAKLLRLIAFVGAITSLTYALGWSNLLTVKRIELTGTSHSAEILSGLHQDQIKLVKAMPMARVDVKAISNSVLRHSWISTAKVSRGWFSGEVKIAITERVPVAIFTDSDGTSEYFDSSGVSFSYPTPVSALPTVSFGLADNASRKAAAVLIAHVGSELLAGLNNLDVSSPSNIIMDSQIGTRKLHILWGDSSEINLKNKVLQLLLQQPENAKKLNYDLQNPRAPISK